MRFWAKATGATITLLSVLACSGLGFCWEQFASRPGHGCCEEEKDAGDAGKRPCASPAADVFAAKLAPPIVDAVNVASPAVLQAPPCFMAFASSFPVKAPPLVLRI
jgi:hypothetical protein